MLAASPPSDGLSAADRVRLALADRCHAMAQALGLRRLVDYVQVRLVIWKGKKWAWTAARASS